ncbi:MAG TPA: MoxR family ATPase [Deltaproteobacteria bacterium]|nr:MoxR family ATPase [Deltaproteobacteria bacterium]
MDYSEAFAKTAALVDNLERVVRGKRAIIELAVAAMLARGHILIEDVPGVGKTTLAHGLARSVDCTFQRIQFTSDLLPSDVTGVTVYNQATRNFEFKPGPVFTNVVLADEINRATPKTQSALLEAMSERQVSVDKVSHPLPEPFMLIATQNPLEYSGTFPLPESQLDRFTMRLRMGYPGRDEELAIMKAQQAELDPEGLEAVVTTDELLAMASLVRSVRVSDGIAAYIMDIVEATRSHEGVRLGVSPRGSMVMYRTAQALALASSRRFCTPDDIKRLAVPVFAHRIIPEGYELETAGNAALVIEEILDDVKVPL